MRSLLLVLLMLFAHPAWAQSPTREAVLTAAVNSVIRPAMANFKNRAGGLDSAMGALCAIPSEPLLAIAAQQFSLAATAFGGVEFVRIGPLMAENRAERLLFFPDRRGIALKQIQALLASADASATDVATLASKSVALQGLGALEYVLFGTGAETLATAEGAFRCRYGEAIARNIREMADQLASDWYRKGGIADHLTYPVPENADYRTETEALEELVGLVSHGLENVRDTRLNPFMAQEGEAAKPKLALFWRSGLTLAMVRANLEGLEKLVSVSGLARAEGVADGTLDNSIGFEFSNAYRALDLVTLPLDEALADPKQAAALDYLVIVTQSLQSQIGEQLAFALGLSVGFSSLDGD